MRSRAAFLAAFDAKERKPDPPKPRGRKLGSKNKHLRDEDAFHGVFERVHLTLTLNDIYGLSGAAFGDDNSESSSRKKYTPR